MVFISDEFYIFSCDAFKISSLSSFSDYDKLVSHLSESFDADIHFLELGKCRKYYVVIAVFQHLFSYLEIIDIYSWIYQFRFPSVIFGNPLLNLLRCRNRNIMPLSGKIIPNPKFLEDDR